jgi:hypothetical protein
MSCQNKNTIINNGGQVIENLDGTVSVFVLNSFNTLQPVIMTQFCCSILDSNYFFDINEQKCRWKTNNQCSFDNIFKIVLNPEGNHGAIFYNDNNNCKLKIEFNYLLKIKCETLFSLLTDNLNGLSDIDEDLNNQINDVLLNIEQQNIFIDAISNQISLLTEQINNSYYSIFCSQTNQTYCLTENEGLDAFRNIIGEENYISFLNGNQNSYSCEDVNQLLNLPNSSSLLFECNTPFGFKSNLVSQLSNLNLNLFSSQQIINNLNLTLDGLQSQANQLLLNNCVSPTSFLESIDMSVTLDVMSGDSSVTVYEDNNFFPQIGLNQLYNYLISNQNSGFFICGSLTCQPIVLDDENQNNPSCLLVQQFILEELYQQSGFQNVDNGLNLFYDSISNNIFNSQWLSYSTVIEDENVINLITNKEIKFGIKINNICNDFCILIDNVKLIKECSATTKNELFINTSPGFTLNKIVDNKKSWVKKDSYDLRTFDIRDSNENNPIRQTNYDVNDERLIINSKEIDLNVNLASAIETDVFCFFKDNLSILTGFTNCNPCVDEFKQFQDDELIYFMDNFPYEFMDQNYIGFNQCCGDNLIKFDELMTTPFSEIVLFEDFNHYLSSELIDAKNRQTISSYPTLKALYDRYLNSFNYISTYSAGFNYYTMEQFADLLGNYWSDIIEQVVPSTTIWGSVRVYSNSIFDQQKFKYKAYSSLLCSNPFFGENVLSPINGISGVSQNVGVSITTLTTQNTGTTLTSKPIVCDEIHIAQMNSGSEFIGTVSVVESSACLDGIVINECLMQVSVEQNEYNATVLVENAALPITYQWSNGATGETTTFDDFGQYSITVTDANCCSLTVNFEIPVVLEACWYTNPDSPGFINSNFQNFATPSYNYIMQSLIVNGNELVTDVTPIYTLTASNFETVMTPAGLTYTNFVTFLNQAFATLGLSNYSAQLALNGQTAGAGDNQGFYIIRPVGDTFSMQISETNTNDFFITNDSMLGFSTYFSIGNCDNITIIDGIVVE